MAASNTKRSLNALNNYMYYGDYEEGDFFAEDLNFKDDKKDSPVKSSAPSDIVSRSIYPQKQSSQDGAAAEATQGE